MSLTLSSETISNNYAHVSVIIITLNEEENIEQCLKSIYGWSDDIHIVDSNSVDKTLEKAKRYTNNIHTIEEGHWATIRNWALSSISLKYEWVIFVDADEWLTDESKMEITQKINSGVKENGFHIPRRFIFLDKWLKHGWMYGIGELRLIKHEKTRYIESGDVEYVEVDGEIGILKNDMMHQDLKPFSKWLDKHNKISTMAAKKYIEIRERDIVETTTKGHYLRKLWNRIPLLLRPFSMFFYVYFIGLGFLDGKEGLIYHLHHAFWYQLLIFTKIKEIEISRRK